MEEMTQGKRLVEKMLALALGDLNGQDTSESQLREVLALLEAITTEFTKCIPEVYNAAFLSDVTDLISLAWLYIFSTIKHPSPLLSSSYARLSLCVFYLYHQKGFEKASSIFKNTLEYGAEVLEISSVSDCIKVLR